MYIMDYIIPHYIYGREAIRISRMLNQLKDEVFIEKPSEDRRCNAKSLLGLLSMGLERGTKIRIVTDSKDHEEVFKQVIKFIEDSKE